MSLKVDLYNYNVLKSGSAWVVLLSISLSNSGSIHMSGCRYGCCTYAGVVQPVLWDVVVSLPSWVLTEHR